MKEEERKDLEKEGKKWRKFKIWKTEKFNYKLLFFFWSYGANKEEFNAARYKPF
jgi:hypothetical protein